MLIVLLLVASVSLIVGGVACWSIPAAAVVAGVIGLGLAVDLARDVPSKGRSSES